VTKTATLNLIRANKSPAAAAIGPTTITMFTLVAG
jgi:hypothetical protein